MDPTASFVLALVAIIVSGISVVASFIAVGQTAMYHPRPFMTAEISPRGTATRPALAFTVVNMGRASAHDVRLVVRNQGKGVFETLWHAWELGVTEPMEAQISKVTGSSDLQPDSLTLDIFPEGKPAAMSMVFELTWRQWPGMKRLRSTRWRVTTDVDSNAVIHTGRERGWLTQSFVDFASGLRDGMSEIWATLRSMF